jgi:hypothetical protein
MNFMSVIEGDRGPSRGRQGPALLQSFGCKRREKEAAGSIVCAGMSDGRRRIHCVVGSHNRNKKE